MSRQWTIIMLTIFTRWLLFKQHLQIGILDHFWYFIAQYKMLKLNFFSIFLISQVQSQCLDSSGELIGNDAGQTPLALNDPRFISNINLDCFSYTGSPKVSENDNVFRKLFWNTVVLFCSFFKIPIKSQWVTRNFPVYQLPQITLKSPNIFSSWQKSLEF